MTKQLQKLFTDFTQAVWGKFDTQESRAALILAEQSRWKVEDAKFEQWLRENKIPEQIVKYRFEQCNNDIEKLKEELKNDKYLFEFFNLIEPARQIFIELKNGTNEGNTKIDTGKLDN